MGLGNWLSTWIRPKASLREMLLEELVREVNQTQGGTVSGALVSPMRAEGLAAVGIAVRLLSLMMAHVPLEVLRRPKREAAFDLDIYGLLHDQPNEWQTAMEWRALLQRDFELRGNGYGRIVHGVGGRVVELLRMHPDRVQPKQDSATLEVAYEYTRPDGRRVVLPRDQVFHLRNIGDDGLTGWSPIRVHRETVGDALSMREYGSRFFSNGAKPLGVIIQPPGVQISPENKEFLKADLRESHSGGANAHKPIIMPPGLDYKPVSINMEDAQYIEGMRFTNSMIYAMFGIPPHKGGDLENAHFTNIEHQGLELVTDALAPRAVLWEQAIKRDLLGRGSNLYAKHNLAALMRGDAKSRAESLQIQRRNGVISANDWRELEDMNPREDEAGDGYIIEANMRPDDGSTDPRSAPPAQKRDDKTDPPPEPPAKKKDKS